MDRRNVLKNMGIAGCATLLNPSIPGSQTEKSSANVKTKFSYCFNSSTIRGQKIDLDEEIRLVAGAGYDGLELWIPVLNSYKESGRSLKDLSKKIKDYGLKVEDAIGFAQWIHPDDTKRNEALEQAKREMEMLSILDCQRIAAPPAGLTDKEVDSYDAVGERFAKLLEIGIQQNVIPQLELWGFSKTLYKTSQLLYVAAQCGMPETRLLTDVYHLYKGGSNFDSLKLIASSAIEVFHMNDYLLAFDRKTITDADRIYPGSGDAPLTSILKDLAKDREKVVLSLELFNPEYYKMEPKLVIEKGLAQMKNAVAKAMDT
ncbi:MAG: sugar phosphate isomerase/epimerase [Saprospiraceae bacterium]